MVQTQRRLNPGEWESLVGDKGLFYRFCRAAGIPVPDLYALLYRQGTGRTWSGLPISTEEEWQTFFLRDCPSPFVVKPTLGHHGLGVLLVERKGERLHTHAGNDYSAAEFVRLLREEGRFDAYVVQKKMTNHPALDALISGGGLATVRVITFMNAQGTCDIVHADLKIPIGGNAISNLSLGASGNMVAHLCLTTGRLTRGIRLQPGRGFLEVERHPESGAEFSGFQLPFWSELRLLASKAASAVLPVRSVGWDVIITPEGPMILEGNFFFDPPNSSLRAADVFRIMTEQ
jgi:hypothetical protein